MWPHVNFLDKGFVYADQQRKGNQNRIFTGGRSDSLESEDAIDVRPLNFVYYKRRFSYLI